MKKIVAILGSPRKWGNTELLLEEFLKEFKGEGLKVKKIAVSDLKITPCNNCSRCLKTGKCIFKDDMDMVCRELREADCLVVAGPVYFTNVPGQLKILIDRCQPLWAQAFVLKKKPGAGKDARGVFLSVCGHPEPSMFNCAVRLMDVLFKVLRVRFYGKVLVPGVDKKGDILKNKVALSKAKTLAKKLIR